MGLKAAQREGVDVVPDSMERLYTNEIHPVASNEDSRLVVNLRSEVEDNVRYICP